MAGNYSVIIGSKVAIIENQWKDSDLLSKFFAGDEAAFHKIFALYNKKLAIYAFKILGDRALAEDTVQETWIKLIDRKGKGQPIEHLAAYLFQIARNCCFDKLRSRKDHQDLAELSEKEHPVTRLAEPSELEEIVTIAFSELTPEDRELLALNIYAGFQYDEIAAMQQKNPQAIWTRASRIRAKLRARVIYHARKQGLELNKDHRTTTKGIGS